MKKLTIHMIVSIILLIYTDLSQAAKPQYYAGRMESGFYTGQVIDCQADKNITIKTGGGKKLIFKITSDTVIGKDCSAEKKTVWLEAVRDIARYVSELPQGVTLQQMKKEIKEISQRTLKELIAESRGAPIFECQGVYESWERRFRSDKYTNDSKNLKKAIKHYFSNWMNWCGVNPS